MGNNERLPRVSHNLTVFDYRVVYMQFVRKHWIFLFLGWKLFASCHPTIFKFSYLGFYFLQIFEEFHRLTGLEADKKPSRLRHDVVICYCLKNWEGIEFILFIRLWIGVLSRNIERKNKLLWKTQCGKLFVNFIVCSISSIFFFSWK